MNRTSLLCGNRKVHHNMELRTSRHITGHEQREPFYFKPGAYSRDRDSTGTQYIEQRQKIKKA